MNKDEELLFLIRRASALTKRKPGGHDPKKTGTEPPKREEDTGIYFRP